MPPPPQERLRRRVADAQVQTNSLYFNHRGTRPLSMDSSADWDQLIEMVEKLREMAKASYDRGYKMGHLDGTVEVLTAWQEEDALRHKSD